MQLGSGIAVAGFGLTPGLELPHAVGVALKRAKKKRRRRKRSNSKKQNKTKSKQTTTIKIESPGGSVG